MRIFQCEICDACFNEKHHSDARQQSLKCEAQGVKEPLAKGTPVLYKNVVVRIVKSIIVETLHTYIYTVVMQREDNPPDRFNFCGFGWLSEEKLTPIKEEEILERLMV